MSEVTKDMIGCLCWVWDNDEKNKRISVLKNIVSQHLIFRKSFFTENSGWGFKHCRPVKPNEIKLFRDADDMLNNYVGLCKIGELKARIKELEKENLTLRYALKGKDCEKI